MGGECERSDTEDDSSALFVYTIQYARWRYSHVQYPGDCRRIGLEKATISGVSESV